jgi:tRNA uracil 4-sulfurtransferase
MSLILIRYGELALKSHKVRRRFEEHLVEGISRQFEHHGLDWIIEREQGRIFLHTSHKNQEKAIDILTHIPGIFSVSPVEDFEIVKGMETILDESERFAQGRILPGQTFVVRARRAGSHAFTSQEAAALVGERILDTIPNLKVKLKHPEVTIYLEIRGKQGFLFTSQTRGMGGLPPGSQGKVILLLSGLNSMVAGYLMMKRGCRILPVHFSEGTRDREATNDGSGDNETTNEGTREKETTNDGSGDEETTKDGAGEKETTNEDAMEVHSIMSSFEPGMKLTMIRGSLDRETIRTLLRQEDAGGLVTGVRYSTWSNSLHIPGEPLFQPLMGLDDTEVELIGSEMKEFHQRTRIQSTEEM